MMESAEQQNSTITDQTQKSIVSAAQNGHAVTLSAEVLVKGHGSEVSTESSIQGMDDGSQSESEHSTSTVNSPSLSSTKALSNDSFSSHSQDTVITSMSATLGASNNNNSFGLAVISPDSTGIIATHQELRAISSPSNSHQQISKLRSGQSSLLSLSTSVNSPKPLSMAGQTVAPPMTMLSSVMGDLKGGQAPVENLSLGGYMELITLQQGGGANSASGSTFSLLPSSQQPSISSSTLQHIPGTSSGLISSLNPAQTGAMPISINPPLLPTTNNPPNYNSSQATNAIFSFQPGPAAIVGGKLPQPISSRSNFNPNPSSAFHQPTTAFATNLLPGNSMSQHSTTPTSSTTPGTKLNLLQPPDFVATGHSALSPQCALPLPNGGSAAALCTGGGIGVQEGGSGGSGRRATKRTHEESIQQDRSDRTNDQEIGTYGNHIGGKVNAFPTDVGGCGSIVVGPGMDGRRGSTSDPLSSQPLQQLKWQAHMVNEWHGLCDGALQDIPKTGFQVETDKGFNFSLVDDSFVCQKKNHFQVTVTIVFHRIPKFLKLKDGSIQPIERFVLDLHGVRFEQVNSCITLEQSKPDRSKTKFEPDIIEVPPKPDEPIKRTVCRLHFSETTQNNMRKRGKPNPDQKHFSLVVSLNAETKEGSYLIVAHVSERIIVRASNPGNFDNDCDYAWLRGTNPEVVYHHGRVGINMDKPEEALSIHGNLHLTGQILQVSDYRVKKNITQLDSRGEHLENISQLQLYEYQLDESLCPTATRDSFSYHTNESPDYTNDRSSCFYDEDTMSTVSMANEGSKDSLQSDSSWRSKGSKDISGNTYHHTTKTEEGSELGKAAAGVVVKRQVGLLAQEVQRVLPNAVRVTESTVHLSDGTSVSNLLVVDKDQILMETIGAVQELRHIASGLQQRLSALEEQAHCSHDLSTERQKCTTTGTGIRIQNWPVRWHPKHILGLLMVASFLLFFAPLLLA